MRITIECDVVRPVLISYDYRYQISAWIYRMIYSAHSEFASWLHDQGYEHDGKRFKLFCYSGLVPKEYNAKKDGLQILQGHLALHISFVVPEGIKHLIKGVFDHQELTIQSRKSNAAFAIRQVLIQPPRTFSSIMRYRARSPIQLARGIGDRKEFLEIDDPEYPDRFIQNLIHKYSAYKPNAVMHTSELRFSRIGNRHKPRLNKAKGISMKGYEYDFELEAPAELQAVGYYGGFGVANSSLGFGYCEVLE